MNIDIKNVDLSTVEAMIIPVYQDKVNDCECVEKIKESNVFKGKEGEVFYFTKEDGRLKYGILVGLGEYENSSSEILRNSIAKATKKARELKVKTLGIKFTESKNICVGGTIKAIAEGARLALYTFDKYKSKKEEYTVDIFISKVPEEKVAKATERLKEVNNIIDGVITARNLVNEPANIIYPETLAKEVESIGKESGFEVEVFGEEEIKSLGMEAFLTVGMGSDKKPKLIVMRYMGDKDSEEITGLVGKGLTYDTGGYSLKPNDSMKDMKSDMGGAAAVIGTISALAKNKVKQNVIAVVAACENAISGGSYKPGDIIGSMAGKTIEVLNTDAEGSLTLADAVTYIVRKERVTKVIDVATLTGAALVALGETTTAVVSNDDEFYDKLVKASEKTGEHFWRLPGYDEYKKMIKSDVADLKNVGGRLAGTITAGLFVGEFVEDKPWLHLDIAGTAWTATPVSEYVVKGATGAPVRTLSYLVTGPCGCGSHK